MMVMMINIKIDIITTITTLFIDTATVKITVIFVVISMWLLMQLW